MNSHPDCPSRTMGSTAVEGRTGSVRQRKNTMNDAERGPDRKYTISEATEPQGTTVGVRVVTDAVTAEQAPAPSTPRQTQMGNLPHEKMEVDVDVESSTHTDGNSR